MSYIQLTTLGTVVELVQGRQMLSHFAAPLNATLDVGNHRTSSATALRLFLTLWKKCVHPVC